ncbi:MAG: flagellar export protein FliJ [Bacillota bacterium]
MRFKFRLEKVKEAKETILEVKQVELAAALSNARREELQLTQIEGEAHSVASAVEGGLARYLNADELEMWMDCFHRLKHKGKLQAQRLREAMKRVDQKRGEAVEARKDVKTLENLKEKRFQEFRAEELKRGQYELDELGLRMKVSGQVEGREGVAGGNVVHDPTGN